MRTRMHGYSLLELLFVVALIGVLSGVALPQVLSARDRSRGLAAARYLAGRMALARTEAATRGAAVALRFEATPRGIAFGAYQDGNLNGVRSEDIADGTDRRVHPSIHLDGEFPGVRIALAPDTPAVDAVQLGLTDILAFSPEGTSTSGTIHVLGADGVQWGVRILGVTGRVRVIRYDRATRAWTDAL